MLQPRDRNPQQLVEEHFGSNSEKRDLETLSQALTETPRRVPTRYLYDHRGSELFEEITVLEEYYQTRSEEALLRRISSELVAEFQPRELIELGSGAATKTRVLLDAMSRQGLLERYVPFDISASIVHRTAEELSLEYPGVAIHGMIGDFVHDLDHLPEGRQRLIVFLGGTIGNFDQAGAQTFLARLRQVAADDDRFLIGFDLIKDRAMLERAYNDARGVTAAFNRNILRVVNQGAGGDFDPELYEHRAPYNEDQHRIEMWLRAREAHTVRLDKLDLELEIVRDEEILTEISTKYDRRLVDQLLDSSGLECQRWYVDENELFALALARTTPRGT